ELPRADDATSPVELVKNYLTVTAWANLNGDKSEELAQAQARARAYLAAQIAEGWKPGPLLNVGRARVGPSQTDENGRTRVTVVWTSLGRLNDVGTIEPDRQAARNLAFTVTAAGLGYRIADMPPAGLLRSDDGLDNFY